MTGVSGSDAVPPPQPPPHYKVPGALVLLVLVLLITVIFMLFPSDKLAPGIATLHAMGPYGIVAIIGAIVGLAEIALTFPNYPYEALRTFWRLLLILVNALAAALALCIARTYAPDANLPLLVL